MLKKCSRRNWRERNATISGPHTYPKDMLTSMPRMTKRQTPTELTKAWANTPRRSASVLVDVVAPHLLHLHQ